MKSKRAIILTLSLFTLLGASNALAEVVKVGSLRVRLNGQIQTIKAGAYRTSCTASGCRLPLTSGQIVRVPKSAVSIYSSLSAYRTGGTKLSYGNRSNTNSAQSAVNYYLNYKRQQARRTAGNGGEVANGGFSLYNQVPRSGYRLSSSGASNLNCFSRRGYQWASGASRNLCYRGVKQILRSCGVTNGNYLSGRYAKNAGNQLLANGFERLPISDPRRAPAGAVIVYDNACRSTHPAGHIEIKISDNRYVSDYTDNRPRNEAGYPCRPVKAIYIKRGSL